MLQHHASWYDFATDPRKFGIRCNREDLVIVRGMMRTSAWAVGAFLGSTDSAQQVTVGAQVSPVAGAKLTLSSEHSEYCNCEQRSGPSRSSSRALIGHQDFQGMVSQNSGKPIKDQCVFLNFYKIKYRKIFPTKIVANGDLSFHGWEDPDDSGDDLVLSTRLTAEVETEDNPVCGIYSCYWCPTSSRQQYQIRSPLDDVLEYILQVSNMINKVLTRNVLLIFCSFPKQRWRL